MDHKIVFSHSNRESSHKWLAQQIGCYMVVLYVCSAYINCDICYVCTVYVHIMCILYSYLYSPHVMYFNIYGYEILVSSTVMSGCSCRFATI